MDELKNLGELKACPFCGRGAKLVMEVGENVFEILVTNVFVRCRVCGARTNTFESITDEGVEDATLAAYDAWNGRWSK